MGGVADAKSLALDSKQAPFVSGSHGSKHAVVLEVEGRQEKLGKIDENNISHHPNCLSGCVCGGKDSIGVDGTESMMPKIGQTYSLEIPDTNCEDCCSRGQTNYESRLCSQSI